MKKIYVNGVKGITVYGIGMVIVDDSNSRSLTVKLETNEIIYNVTVNSFREGLVHSSFEDIGKFKKGTEWRVLNGIGRIVGKRKYKCDIEGINGEGYAFDVYPWALENGNATLSWNIVGTERANGDGRIVKILEVVDSENIRVQLEKDGIKDIVVCPIKDFINKSIGVYDKRKEKFLNSLKGKRVLQPNSGMFAEVKNVYRENGIIICDILFDDGKIVDGVTYANFCAGSVKHPEKRLHIDKIVEKKEKEVVINKDGRKSRLKRWRGNQRVDVVFINEDGTEDIIVEDVNYRSFKAGNVKHPDDETIVGEIVVNTDGFRMKMENDDNTKECNILFEDGREVTNSKSNFLNGSVGHPLFKGTKRRSCKAYGDVLDVHREFKTSQGVCYWSWVRYGEYTRELGTVENLMTAAGIKPVF